MLYPLPLSVSHIFVSWTAVNSRERFKIVNRLCRYFIRKSPTVSSQSIQRTSRTLSAYDVRMIFICIYLCCSLTKESVVTHKGAGALLIGRSEKPQKIEIRLPTKHETKKAHSFIGELMWEQQQHQIRTVVHTRCDRWCVPENRCESPHLQGEAYITTPPPDHGVGPRRKALFPIFTEEANTITPAYIPGIWLVIQSLCGYVLTWQLL